MKDNFYITGLFYQLDEFKCRKYLNIKKRGTAIEIPDLMVIMMNPGKSKPIDGIDDNYHESEASPDQTQNQIMRIMLNCGFEYSRILNLSDARETSSGKFYQMIPYFKSQNILHSIFDNQRKDDLENLLIRDTKTIFSWGVNNSLTELTKNAVEKIGLKNSYGIKKDGTEFAYYHPLPPNYHKQNEWVEEITKQIKTA